jgi:hypothetical protein
VLLVLPPTVLLLASYKGSALEAAVSRRVGEKMDVWSLGVCLFELAAGTGSGCEARDWAPYSLLPSLLQNSPACMLADLAYKL